MKLTTIADILLVSVMIISFILTYIENYELGCFKIGSFIITTIIFAFSYIYGRFLAKFK